MKIKVNKNKYFFFQLAVLCLLIGIICSFILPSKFYNDAELIVNDPYGESGLMGSYPFTMLFYKITLLKYLPYFLVAIIQLPILFYIIYKIGVPSNFKVLSIQNTVIYIGFFLIALFICIPSKEFINFSYIAAIAFLFKNKKYSLKKTVVISFVLFFIFSAFFRTYYAFIPIFSLVMYVCTYIKFRYKVFNIIIISIFVAIFMSLAYGMVKGEYISASTRESHNNDRIGSSEAQSMLQSPVPTDTWYGETIGIYYGYISVNIPLNGLEHFMKPQVIAFVIWQLLLFTILLVRFGYCIRHRQELKYELWLFLFIFSYFVVQGLFEPDLGSAVRHKFSIFPFIYLAFYYDKIIKDKGRSNS